MNLAAPRRRAALALGLALVLVAALAPMAGAQGAGKDAEKEARRLFQSAELSFNVGKFAEALADYQAAYEAKPLPGFLFNIAQCYRNMGDYERARFFFRRYLSLDPRSPNRRRVEALTDEMTRKLQESPPKVEPRPEAKADTKPPETQPAEPPPASPAVIDEAKVPDGVAPSPALSLAAPAQPAETAPASLVVAAPPAPSPVWKRWWFWTAAGVVLVGGAVAAIVLSRPETVAPGTLDPIDGRP